MAVTIQDVEHIARLARLAFSEAEKEVLTRQLNEILAYVEQLQRIDTSAVEPLSHVVELENVFREDVDRPGIGTEEALRNAPNRTGAFFSVPNVLGEK